MANTKHILLALIPAVLFLGAIVWFEASSYRSLFSGPVTQTQPSENKELDIVPILPNDPLLGDPRAPNTIIAFEDYGCHGCAAQEPMLQELFDTYPTQLKLIWKGLPINRLPNNTERAHEYAFCAEEQALFTQFKSHAFANSTDLSVSVLNTIATNIHMDLDALTACLTSGRAAQKNEEVKAIAKILGIQTVPTFFVNGTQIATPSSVAAWKTVLGL